MKKKKFLTILMASMLIVGTLGGCSVSNPVSSTKIEVKKENAFDTVPENKLVPKFVTERYKKNDELRGDYETITQGIIFGNETENLEEVKSKLGINAEPLKYTLKGLYEDNKDFYSGFAHYITTKSVNPSEATKYANEMLLIAQDYLANTLMGEENEVSLAPEFKELEPEKYVKKYLKENDIEITNVVYPQRWNNIHIGVGSTIIDGKVTIEGTQKGKKFRVEKIYNFHFTATEDIRTGGNVKYEKCHALIGVTDNCFDTETINTFLVDKLLKLSK